MTEAFREAAERAAVVAAARRWLGTPYHPCADILGAGVDCGMLIVRVFVDCGLAPAFDPRPYAQDWHLHRGEEKYLNFVLDLCEETRTPAAGDLMLFKWGRCYSHGGILVAPAPVAIIHAYQPAGLVLEEQVACNGRLATPERAPRFFTRWKKGETS